MTVVVPTAEQLERDHPGLSLHVAGAVLEALRVVLDRHHSSPTQFAVVDGSDRDSLEIEWVAPTMRLHDVHADASRATEWAAELVALLSVHQSRRLVVVRRAPRGSRVDFYVGVPGDRFENAVLLEIAGRDDVASLSALLAEKIDQARRNPDGLPALAAVVRFARPHVMIRDA